jgi:hypothetical protein
MSSDFLEEPGASIVEALNRIAAAVEAATLLAGSCALHEHQAALHQVTSERNAAIASLRDVIVERDLAEDRVRRLQALERSVNEALNRGDGSYRP